MIYSEKYDLYLDSDLVVYKMAVRNSYGHAAGQLYQVPLRINRYGYLRINVYDRKENAERLRATDKRRYYRNRDKRLSASNDYYAEKMKTQSRVLFADGSHHWLPKDEADLLFKIPVRDRVWNERNT